MKKALKKIILIAVAAIMTVCLFACGGTGGNDSGKDKGESLNISQIVFTEDMQEDAVNWYGRYFYNKNIERVNLNNTAAGFEVKFSGTKLSIVAYSNDLNWQITGSAYIGVSVDGGEFVRKTVPFGEGGNIILAEGLKDGVHTAKVLKSSEASSNTWELEKIVTDGSFYKAPEKPKYTIEVYGDSITAGHSALKTGTKDTSRTDEEDGLATYGFKAAAKIGATAQVFCVSGQRVGDYGGGANSTIPTLSGLSDPVASGKRTWDRKAHPVDAVVIDLGTNDIIGAYNNAIKDREPLTAEERVPHLAATKELIASGYKPFVRQLRDFYPDAPVIICHGTFYYGSASWTGPAIQDYDEFFETLASELNEEIGKVYSVQFEKCRYGHPAADENEAYSVLLAAKLREALGITA